MNDTLKTIHAHRSIRSYKPDPIPEDLLHEIIAAGIRASSSGNMQSYSIIVTRNQALRQRLYVPHMEQRMVLEAPVLVTFCADFNRMRHWLAINDAPDNFDDIFGFMVAAIDAVLVAQNVALAAESCDLGICYLGSTLANCDQIGDILACPPGVVPVTGFSLGYPAEDPAPRDRLPYEALVHSETYHDYSDEDIGGYYRERDVKGWERYMTFPRLRRMIEESNAENLAQVYTMVKYTAEKHGLYSRNLLDYLAQQDFMRDV